jgi:aromatase
MPNQSFHKRGERFMIQVNNSIIIHKNRIDVFNITNNVANWPGLFTEYKAVEILKQADNYVKFRLTTFPHEEHEEHSWISERRTDSDRYEVRGRRLDNLSPFSVMKIFWKYKDLGENSCRMIWVQTFGLCKDSPYSTEQVMDYLNRNSREQMKIIKRKIEKR